MSQQLLFTLKTLYAANGVVGVSLYIPQILRVLKDKKQAQSLSMVTFGGWSLGSLITVFYAWFYAHDLLFAGLSLANMFASGTMFLLVLNSRLAIVPLLRRLVRRAARAWHRLPIPRLPLQIDFSSEGMFMWVTSLN